MKVDVIIETPKGSAEKYDYVPEKHLFKLKKILPAGMVFPYDFGFIPDTKGDDGDPLDIIVISEFKSFPGCMMECRIIGAMLAEQTEDGKTIRNDRFIAVPHCAAIFSKIQSLEDLPGEIIDEIEDFFIDYNKIEGRKFKPVKKLTPHQSFKLITENRKKNK